MGPQLQSSATVPRGRARLDGAVQPTTLVAATAHDGSLASGLARQATRVGAQGRLEGALRSIAIDLLGMNESDELPAACADWVATTTEAAVSTVSDSALEALVRGLDSRLLAIPPDIARQLDRAKARRDAGFE